MVRISDAPMSGTAFGTVVLHVTPEAHVLGPQVIVQNSDWISLNAESGELTLEVDNADIQQRLNMLEKAPAIIAKSGYLGLYLQHVMQADEGCDFDFLVGCRGTDVPAHSH